jgi:anhydro-N-acetylmuramic acid kinase
MTLYIGLMSGTSMDGVDGVLVEFDDTGRGLHVITDAHVAMPPSLGAELLALNQSGPDELQRAALAANALARLQADVVAHLLVNADLEPHAVRAVGSHGQTVRHRPGEFDGIGFTLQLNNGALLAEACGIDVICDFRTRDVAAGGQGAPLVPAFHRDVFGGAQPRAVLNIGGLANVTVLPAMAESAPTQLVGFDTGPGNALMDHWCRFHTDAAFDDDGRWAASGQVDGKLLAELLADAYFRRPAPKSTGRDLFNAAWLAAALARVGSTRAPADVQATLLELTARSAIDSLRAVAPATHDLLVCGGGSRNGALMARLAALWPGLAVSATDTAGLPAMQVEATAFAWLARQFCERQPGNHPGVTGAAGLRVLGALYPR